jgi:hypothetical protein
MSIFLPDRGGEAEEWLAPDEAMQLIRDCLQTSIGHARALVEKAIESREVRVLADAKDTGLRGHEMMYAKMATGMPSKNDLLNWLDRHGLLGPMPVREHSQTRRKSKRATPKNLDEAWDAFQQSGCKITMDDFCEFARDKCNITDQEALREKYRDMCGNPTSGPRRRIP